MSQEEVSSQMKGEMPNMVLFNIFINDLELIKFAGDIKAGKNCQEKAWKKYKMSTDL